MSFQMPGTSQFTSPATALPYTFCIPDYRLGSTILDIKTVGTPLSGPQVIDFMNFGIRATCALSSTILGKMQTKQQLAGALVGLKEMNSRAILNNREFVTHEICVEGDIPLVQRMFAIIDELFDTFDYPKSPEFLRLVEGKSAEVLAMRLKLITPQRRTQMRKRLGDALAMVLHSDEVLELVELARQERIKELRNLLMEVSNPD